MKRVKRLLGLLLALTMVLGMVPGMVATAGADGDKTITGLGTGAIAKPSSSGGGWSYVYYGKYDGTNATKYRVLDPNTTVFGGKTMLLDCDAMLFEAPFNKGGAATWDKSTLKSALNGDDFLAKEGNLTLVEGDAIALSTKASPATGETSLENYRFSPLTGEKVFLLDTAEVTNASYGYKSDGNRKKAGGEGDNGWWLRSACYFEGELDAQVPFVNANEYIDEWSGEVLFRAGGVYTEMAWMDDGILASPAFNVDLSYVLFSSLISGTAGKAGAEYKLTLTDANLAIAVTDGAAVSKEEKTVTVPYTISGTNAANATQVSVLIMDEAFTPLTPVTTGFDYQKLKVASFALSGTGTFTIPDAYAEKTWGTDYHVYLVAEDVNGGKLTDYASAPVELPAPKAEPIVTPPKAKELTCDGTPQELVTAGTVTGGTMQYALGENDTKVPETGWSTAVPAATKAGVYYVWYKVVGDSEHSDTDAACIKVTIKPETEQNAVLDALEKIETTGMTPNEIREQVQAIDSEALGDALLADNSVAEAIRELEALAGVAPEVAVTDNAPGFMGGVTMIGAGLNNATGNPKLVIDEPKQVDVLPEGYSDTAVVRFSMELTNVTDADNLKVPVLIDLPVPAAIDPAKLVILHYHKTTSDPETIKPTLYQSGSKWHAQFVVTRMSDFIMAEKPEEEDKIEAFVTRCYSLILDRAPDAAGLADWVGKLKAKTRTASEIIYGFMYSPEYTKRDLGNEKTVEILYKTMLDREPDAGGKADWLNRLANGAEIKDIINGFCGSPEFLKLCESYGIIAGAVTDPLPEGSEKIQAFVTRCYKLILNRDPDALGFADWVIQLANKTRNASEIIYGFMYSAEYTARGLSNAETVEILYNTMLNRASDDAGKTDWLNRLAGGQTIVDIINGFCGSPEFNALCAEYGIEPGRVATGGVKVVKTAAAQPAADERAAEPVKNNGYLAFVSRCYQIALGREAIESELSGWAAQETNLKQTAKAILFSDEAQAKLAANEEFVKVLYRLYLNREADAEGFAYWTEKLNAGESREAVVNVFEASDEFKAVLKGLKTK